MGLFDFLKSPPPIAAMAELEDFLDQRAAFLVQKCAYEYSRARSGIQSRKLFKEETFRTAIRATSWSNFPYGLAWVSVMVEHVLRDDAGVRAPAMREGLKAAAAAVTHRYPVPENFDAGFWREAAGRVADRIDAAGAASVQPIKDIPLAGAGEFIANLPIHPDIRTEDSELLTNNLRFNLCRAHDEFVAALDRDSLIEALATGKRNIAPPALRGRDTASDADPR